MTSSAPDPISPSFSISSSAAQEFIAWQSAEIARLRAHTDQLETRSAHGSTHESEDGGSQGMFDRSAVSVIKEHISSSLQELVAGLKDELVNRTAEHGDAPKQPEYDSLIKEIREDVTQCKNNISELNNRLKRVGEMLQECADGALQACRVATQEIAKRDSGSTELTKELESTRRALERFRVPELVLTARWEDGGVTVAHPLGRNGDPEGSVTEDVEVQERLRSSTPSIVSFEQEEPDADAEPHIEYDSEAENTNVPQPDDARSEEEPTLPASPPDALPNAEPANAVVASASLASEASTDFVHVPLPGPSRPVDGRNDDACSTGSDSEIASPSDSSETGFVISFPTTSPSAKASLSLGSFGGGAFGRSADRVAVAETRTIKDLYKPLPYIDDPELTSSIRDELISACGISGISVVRAGCLIWRDCPKVAWLVRPATILAPKSVKSRMKSKCRHPELWEPQEFIGTFSGLWYYFGTYSVEEEPVPITKEEFIQLPYKDKEAFVTAHKRLHSLSSSVPQLIDNFERGSLAAAKYVVHKVGFKEDVDEYLRDRLVW